MKEQILSARWGINEELESDPPELPDELMEAKDIQEWCKVPYYQIKKSN